MPYVANDSVVAGSYTGSSTFDASVERPATTIVWITALPRAAVANGNRTSARWPAGIVTRLPRPPPARFARAHRDIDRARRLRRGSGRRPAARTDRPARGTAAPEVRALILRCVTIVPSPLPNQYVCAVASATMRNRVRLSGIFTVTVDVAVRVGVELRREHGGRAEVLARGDDARARAVADAAAAAVAERAVARRRSPAPVPKPPPPSSRL